MKEKRLRLPDYIFKDLTEQLYDGVYFVNPERKILFWNRQAEKITGYRASEVVGKFCHDNILRHIDAQGRLLCLTMCPLVACIKKKRPCAKRVYLRRKDGVRLPVDIHTAPVSHEGKIIGAIEVFRDASVYERMERQRDRARDLAQIDPLTALPNRRYIFKKLESEIRKFGRLGEEMHLAVLDVDHFKKINDRFGHDVGDRVLKRIAGFLEQYLRPTDHVGRYGGEEFIVILTNTPRKNADLALTRIRKIIQSSRLIPGKTFRVTASIGVTRVRDGDTTQTAFSRADKALYRAKRTGRNRIVYSAQA